jgi:hypothetical protein
MAEVKGKIAFIDPIRKVNDNFSTRNFAVDCSEEINGSFYEKFVGFQMNRNLESLDRFNVGDEVNVTYGLSFSKPYKKDGKVPTEKNPDGHEVISNLIASSILLLKKSPVAETPVVEDAGATQEQKESKDGSDFDVF